MSTSREELERLIEALEDEPMTDEEGRDAVRRLGIDVTAWAAATRERVDAAERDAQRTRVEAARAGYRADVQRLARQATAAPEDQDAVLGLVAGEVRVLGGGAEGVLGVVRPGLQVSGGDHEALAREAGGERGAAGGRLVGLRDGGEVVQLGVGPAGLHVLGEFVGDARVQAVLPLRDRLLRGTPVLRAEDDVFTNHVHADDLARACALALWRGRAQRVFHVVDDTVLKMGDYFDLAADLYGLPRPPRVARDAAKDQLPLMLLSFMGESRRLTNQRLKQELRLRLHHPTVAEGLRA